MANVLLMTPRFLLAKYVANLSRMEPRNIGVLLWANGEIASRFLSKSEAPFVGDHEAYDWWIGSWQEKIASDSIAPVRGARVSKSDPRCMDALLTNQEDNYLLVDAGELLQPIGKRELSSAVDFLFGDLVSQHDAMLDSGAAHRTSPTLRENCERIFAATGLSDRKDYHENYPVQCPVYSVKKHLNFNHGFGNGKPDSVFQQANLKSQQSVNSSALMLHAVTDSTIVPKSRCAALARESDISSEAAEEGVALLKAVCRVIFVDKKNADEELLDVALNGRAASVARPRPKRT
jgi:hypothetical protein